MTRQKHQQYVICPIHYYYNNFPVADTFVVAFLSLVIASWVVILFPETVPMVGNPYNTKSAVLERGIEHNMQVVFMDMACIAVPEYLHSGHS